jgi:cell division protein FtsQ
MTPPPGTDTEAPPARRPAPIDPRIRARRIEVQRDAGRRRLHRLTVAGVVAGVLLLVVASAFTPVADVDRIEVEGMFRTSSDAIVEAGGVERGDPTLLVDTGAAAAAIGELPWIADVDVQRSFPGTIRYVVHEREPLAVAGTPDGRAAVVDREGRVVEVAEGEAAALGLPVLEGVVGPTEVGARLGAAAEPVLRVARDVPGGLVASVAAVRTGDDGVELALVPTGTAHLGEADDLDGAFVALASVLGAVRPACVGVIDVAVPSAPVLTRVPGCQ